MGSVPPGRAPVVSRTVIVCKTVGSAYVDSSPTPATTKTAPMGTLAVKRRGVLARWLACGCRAGLTALWLFLIAAVIPAAVWSGVRLERPEPRSGEDERAGRRRAAADHRRRGRVSWGWGAWVSPGVRGWRGGLTCTHPAPAGGAGGQTGVSGDRV